jgi:hypothetical protein
MADNPALVATAPHATAANCTAFALMKFLVGKGVMSIDDMRQVFLDAAEVAKSPYDHFGHLDPTIEAAAKILESIAAELGRRSAPG